MSSSSKKTAVSFSATFLARLFSRFLPKPGAPMDLETLSAQLNKDPESYAEEYKKILLAYSSMIDIPVQNSSRVKQFLSILSPYIFKIDTEFPSVAVKHLQKTTDEHIRKDLVRLLVFFYNKRLIEPRYFFRLYLEYADKLEVSAVTKYCEISCLDVFIDYLRNGNDRQKPFSFLMVVYIYENLDFSKAARCKEKWTFKISSETSSGPLYVGSNANLAMAKCLELIMENLFTAPKLIKIAVLYFLNEIDFCVSENPKIVECIGFSTAEKLCKKLITNIRAKQDLRATRVLKYRVITVLKKYYGLDIRIGARLLRLIDPTKEDLKDILALVIDAVDESEVESVVDKILETFCCEHKDDDFIAYGLNILREFVLKFDIGEYVHGKINFRLGKSRSVFYAQSALLKAIKGCGPGREVFYVRKKATKEEKLRAASEGRGSTYFKRKALRKRNSQKTSAVKRKCSRGRKGK